MGERQKAEMSGSRLLPDLEATAALAASLASRLTPGDVIGLSGPLGAGKTTFARFVIHALEGGVEVPSPTFNLVLTYATSVGEIWHFDLFRLNAAHEAYELGIEDAFASAISLIEWPDRLGSLLPPARLDLQLEPLDGDERRHLTWRAHGASGRRLAGALAEGGD